MDPKRPYADCENCPLKERPLVPGAGPPPEKCRCVIIGEAPGNIEAKYGAPFVGQSGQLLRRMMHFVDIDGGWVKVPGMTVKYSEGFSYDNAEVYFTNACVCHPPGNKLPNGAVTACTKRLAAEIKPYWDAGVPICALGVIPGQVLVGRSEKSLAGKWYKDGRILCSWHPAHVLRLPKRWSELMMDLEKLARGKPMEIPYPEYEIPRTPAELDTIIDRAIAEKPETICFDLETDQLMWWKHKILCAAFATSYEWAFVIPEELIYEESTARSIDRLFGAAIDFVGHNVKFDLRYMFHQMGVTVVPRLQDTLVAHHALNENMLHGLKPLLTAFFDIGDYEGNLIHRYLRTRGDFYSKVPRPKLYEYNVLDVCYTLRLWDVLKSQLLEDEMYEMPYQFPMMASQPMLLDMELEGIQVNTEQLKWLQVELGNGIVQLQGELEEECGTDFNPNSWKQVSEIMYGHFKCPRVKGRGFKPGSTCQQARRLILLEIDHESKAAKWLVKFDQLKSLVKLKSSYVDNVWRFLDDNNRVHPDGLIYGTESGRLSFRDPPIQTIPRPGTGSVLGDAWGQYIRGYYIAPEGYKMVEVDISQAEMRVGCALSGEPFLHKVYAEGTDLHTMVALEMYGPDFTKDQRNACKKFNFAYLYGGTEHSFALEEGMDIKIAREFVRRYKQVMPVLTAWKDSMLQELRQNGYVATRTGRRRRFPLITDDNLDDARKAAVNMPVQGMASDVTLITAIRVWEWFKREGWWGDKATLIGLIHDSVLMIVRDDYVQKVGYNIKNMMQAVGYEWVPEVPWKCDIDIGQDWGHLKDISKWPEFVLSVGSK